MTHDFHRNPDVVLDDDCAECVWKSDHINTLDRRTLLWLVKCSEVGHFGRKPTQAERNAESHVWHALLIMETLTRRDWRDVIGRDVLAETLREVT
jgi:hypothetical protein